jgi:hypothetical protein
MTGYYEDDSMHEECESLRARLAEAERIMRDYVEAFQKPGFGMLTVEPMIAWLAAADSATVPLEDALWESLHGAPWPGPHGVCPDGTPHMPKNGECIKCRNAVTVSEVTK